MEEEDFIVVEVQPIMNHCVFIGSLAECNDYVESATSEYELRVDVWRDPTE